MFHHDSRDYERAASEAAAKGRVKMEEIIHRGLNSAKEVAEQVENMVPEDYIAPASTLSLVPIQEGYALSRGNGALPLHEHALQQVCTKTGMPHRYLDDLTELGDWGKELVAHNVNELLQHSSSRHLIRTVPTKVETKEVRGFLSDRYRRLDSRPLLDAFMSACHSVNAVPIEGYALDTKVRMRAVLPVVFEPVPNEVMLFGVQWGNSDFGDGGHCISLWNMRVWCTNTAVMDEVLRQVHLGRRLDDNIVYSQQTYELDSRTNASALQDVVRNTLSPIAVNGYLEAIRKAAEETIGERDVLKILKAKLTKGEAEQVDTLFRSPDVVNMPEGQTVYRLSNAVSWFAQAEGISRKRQLELQEIAGNILPPLNVKAREV